MSPLSRRELDYYVTHRLRVAGYTGDRLFHASALNALHRASAGVPRLINVMAHKALLAAFGEGRHYVSASNVRMAAADTPFARRASGPLLWASIIVTVLAAGAIYWYLIR